MIMEIAGEPSTGVAEMTTVEMATAEMVAASEVATIKVAAHASGAKMPAVPAHTEAAAAAAMAAPTASATSTTPAAFGERVMGEGDTAKREDRRNGGNFD